MRETHFVCLICGRTWETLPEDAVRLTNLKGRGHGLTNTYQFTDGSIHVIKKTAQRAKGEVNGL